MRRLALAGAAALLLAGCSGSDESGSDSASGASGSELSRMEAAEVVDASFTALEESGAAHVVGSIDENGAVQELDLQLEGDDVAGSITMDGVSVELISVGGQAYVQAPADFWASFGMPAEFAGQLEGQWVLMPAEAAGSFASLTLSGLVAELRASGGDTVKGEVTTDELDGEKVVVVTQENGSTFTTRDDDENPYPLVIEEQGDAPAMVEFSDFGEPAGIAAPPNPVDLTTLGG
ncbi:hypothetical protein [Blastococcus sp. LR1]|uniref:hypothetical protein n=1 Tax=Blastococcus sp. LR1 TaxID=2877000 RepID=UPI001CCF1DEF|nr:hypothetical protein [Blastococcus sp. LR1]MCA0145696.1 hypothetical protein [Blastococcus sp. LR1]